MKQVLKQGLGLVILVSSLSVFAQVSVTTFHNDGKRTGGNTAETVLTTANVNTSSFGKLFNLAVDDEIFGQPLYVVGGVAGKDAVYVGTASNTVYAFDAKAGGSPLWQKSLTPAGARPPNHTDVGVGGDGFCGGSYNDFRGNIGIVGTPVIDNASKTIYLVTRTIENGTHFTKLHALDIANGNARAGSPVTISASLSGTGDGGSTINFKSKTDAQRASLALVNGNVYIPFASNCDVSPYHGWVLGYNASSLAQVGKFAITRDGKRGAIWAGGQGPSIDDSGNLIVATGNGDWNGTTNFGESIVKINAAAGGALSLGSFFTPSNWSSLNGGDTDLGSGGVLIIPGANKAVQGGKDGQFHVVNTGSLGGLGGAAQQFQAVHQNCCSGHIHGAPVYFRSASNGALIYVWGENDVLRAYKFDPVTNFNTTAFKTSTMRAPQIGSGMSGGILSVSSNGTSNGILWANAVYDGDALHDLRPGILRAFDANDVSRELWNNHQIGSDDCGAVSKYAPVTVANGRVYQPSFANGTSSDPKHGQICVYGLKTQPVTIINALSVKDTGNAVDWSIGSNLQVGNAQYGDRAYTFTSIPSILVGADWIRTANDSKNFTGNPAVTFTLTRTADVYVGVDTRVPALSWMTGWTNTGLTLKNNEGTPSTFTLFKKNFVAGTVTLGPSTSAGSMYTVIAK